MAMVVNISRLKCLLAFLVLAWFTAYGKRHPTSTCPGKASLTTGRLFNQPDTLHVVPSKGKLSIPGMVYIEGGGMLMGSGKPITVNSFYMDQAPITNLDYREYLYDLKKSGLQQEYEAAIPHKEVWKEYASCYNDPYVTYMDSSEDHYLYSSTFMYYPVVAVTWEQAMAYCKWRTQKFKETVIKRQKKQKPATDNGIGDQNKEQVHVEENEPEGNSYPVFRLPTEAEWEYAARGIVGVAGIDYLQRHQRNYPWSGSSPRGKDGQFLANFKRGKGNYRGMAGESNHSAPTTYIYHYPSNELGLYDIVGNVCCWVSDTYTPLFLQDTGDLNPVIRGESLSNNGDNTNDGAKVYKGCSWADCAYFLQIGTRRYLNKDRATPTIGFRCVVSSVD